MTCCLKVVHNRCYERLANNIPLYYLRTIPDPECPDDGDELYFVLVDIDIDNITELKRSGSLAMPS